MEFANRVISLIQPFWFRLFIVGVLIGAFVAHIQKIKS
jgi:hypothetical protein